MMTSELRKVLEETAKRHMDAAVTNENRAAEIDKEVAGLRRAAQQARTVAVQLITGRCG